MSSRPIILVTGGTGYVGSHVVQQLLEQKKYIVRATARQTSKLFSTFPHAGTDLQVVHVQSLTADHSDVLRGVWALIHCAAPITAKNATGREIFDGAYNGAVNVVQDAIKAGVKKIVVTGSISNLLDPDLKTGRGPNLLSEKSWGVITSVDDVDLENGGPDEIYMQAKTLSEKKIWGLAHENQDVDVTVLIPPLIAGPFVANAPTPANRPALGSIGILYGLIAGGPDGPNTYPAFPSGYLIDVRDCAKAHVLSLATPPLKGRDKRFLIEWPSAYTWKDAADVIRAKRPELANRLPPTDAAVPPALDAPHDFSFTEEVLGLKNSDYITFEETILATIDELISWEKKTNSSR